MNLIGISCFLIVLLLVVVGRCNILYVHLNKYSLLTFQMLDVRSQEENDENQKLQGRFFTDLFNSNKEPSAKVMDASKIIQSPRVTNSGMY